MIHVPRIQELALEGLAKPVKRGSTVYWQPTPEGQERINEAMRANAAEWDKMTPAERSAYESAAMRRTPKETKP